MFREFGSTEKMKQPRLVLPKGKSPIETHCESEESVSIEEFVEINSDPSDIRPLADSVFLSSELEMPLAKLSVMTVIESGNAADQNGLNAATYQKSPE
jgi:hypothetical protein